MPKRSAEGMIKTMQSQQRAKQWKKTKTKGKFPKGLKTLISQTVRSLSEEKIVIATGSNVALPCASLATPNHLNLCPQISQGSSHNTRTGNEVRVTSCTVRGHVTILPYNATTNTLGAPALVKIWICRYKNANVASMASTNADTAFFDTGASTTGMGTTILDMSLYPNPDSWDVLETKTFKVGIASQSATFPVGINAYYDNSPCVVPFRFDVGKYLKGPLMYQDTSNTCTNKNLFFVIEAVYAQGNITNGLSIAELSYAYQCKYTDA